jgi:large subunit ribosomal protein L9
MKVFLLKNVEKVGMAHEIVKVSEGFATNYLIPNKLAVEVGEQNEKFFLQRAKTIDKRAEVMASKTSMLAEQIKSIKLTIRRKLHDDGKLYGSIKESEIADLLAAEHKVAVKKNQIDFGSKSIKAKGSYEITVKLSSELQPKITLNVVSE